MGQEENSERAPEGRNTCYAVFMPPLPGLVAFQYYVPTARAVGHIMSPLTGLAGNAGLRCSSYHTDSEAVPLRGMTF